MATAAQIKALIRSHFSDESERFFTAALQVAAHEAGQGHSALAREIRDLVDLARKRSVKPDILHLPPDLQGLVSSENPNAKLNSLVLPRELMDRLQRVLHEYRQQDKLKQHGLSHRRKLLLTGPAGTGKTLTARVLSYELRLPLYKVQVDRLVTKFMGETSAKLRQIFDIIAREKGVYLFDEFDAIGGGRSLDNDVGEMRRVLGALLQFIEQDTSDSLIVAATNCPELLDRALFRRFEDVLQYALPTEDAREQLIGNTLGTFIKKSFGWKLVLAESEGLSSADIDLACRDALKNAVLADQNTVDGKDAAESLRHRRQAQTAK